MYLYIHTICIRCNNNEINWLDVRFSRWGIKYDKINKKTLRILVKILYELRHFGDLYVYRIIILKLILVEIMKMDSVDL